jgi:tetratricopeptide (TPR) repeat protein
MANTTDSALTTTTTDQQRENNDKSLRLVPIYLDETDKTEASRHSFHSLCKSTPYIKTFRDADQCIRYIEKLSAAGRKAILIVSTNGTASSVKPFLEKVWQLTQVNYILAPATEDDARTSLSDSSITNYAVYQNVESVCQDLSEMSGIQRKRMQGLHAVRDDFDISTISATLVGAEQLSSRNYRQEAQFMYALLLRAILLTLESTLEDMLKFCRSKFDHNTADMKHIEEFEDYYEANNAVFWYTRDIFLYRLLNTALREQDVDTLCALSYYIKDLHTQITEFHGVQRVSRANTFLVYRGQLMVDSEFDKKIRHNAGGFLSVSGFFSTTAKRTYAEKYAGDGPSLTDKTQSVLYEITIDEAVSKFQYADISASSAFGEEEAEVLFTMGAVFRIKSVEQDRRGIWIVKLQLTDEEDKELGELTFRMVDETLGGGPTASLANLMLKMGNYRKAEKLFVALLNNPSIIADSKCLVTIHNNLGLAYKNLEQLLKAIEHYETALQMERQLPEPDPSTLASTMNNLGLIYQKQGNSAKALEYFEDALDILRAASEADQSLIATIYNNIGVVHGEQRRFPQALVVHKKALKIRQDVLTANHPDIAQSLVSLSQIYHPQREYKEAEKCLKEALEIEKNSLGEDHISLAGTYTNLAMLFYEQLNFEEAIKYGTKDYEIKSKNLGESHPHTVEARSWLENVKGQFRVLETSIHGGENK